MQDSQLFHAKEQEKNQGEAGNEKALQEMQKAHQPQGSKIVLGISPSKFFEVGVPAAFANDI